MTGVEWAVASLVVGASAAVQGAVGFGLVLVAAPIVTMLDPRLVPGPMLVAALVITVVMAVRERAGLDVRAVGWAVS
ncbi:MAG TPA: sulfite exporter TauE/SafE family protein, partial [Actinomycetota bacterium]